MQLQQQVFVFPWENGIVTTYSSEADEMRKISHYCLMFVKVQYDYRRGKDIITIQFVLTTGDSQAHSQGKQKEL